MKIFKKGTTLSEEEKKKLEDAYKKMRDECIYEYIDNYLQNQNVALGSIYMADPGWMGQAGITSAEDLKFADSDEITPGALKHEWFHLFQMEYHGMSSFEERGMMEWEQALLADILVYIDLRGDLSTSTHSWACFNMQNISSKDVYLAWLARITDDGAIFPTVIDQGKFENFGKVFGDLSRIYNSSNEQYNYSNRNYKPSAIQALFEAAQDLCR